MASTFFGYAERDADSLVNWASVGQDMSDMLAETNKVRQEKKSAIDQATRDSLMQLSQAPQGENIGARTEILRYAAAASERIKIDDRLLKSGELSLQEYTIRRQNINDGTNLAFNANKAYQEMFTEVMNDDTLSELVRMNFAEVESFGNWNTAGMYITPNGTVMSAKKEMKIVDGKRVYTMSDKPGDLKSADNLNTAIYGRTKKVDINTPMQSFVDNLGIEQSGIIRKSGLFSQGNVTTIDDITTRNYTEKERGVLFSFLNAENGIIDSIIGGSDIRISSILVDRVVTNKEGKAYSLTYDPAAAKKDSSLILKGIGPNGQEVYLPSDDQKQNANEFIRNQLRAKYDRKVDITSTGQLSRNDPPQAKVDADNKNKEDDANIQRLGKIYSGTPAEIAASFQAIMALNPDIKGGKRTPNGIEYFEEVDGKKVPKTISFRADDNTLLSEQQFIERAMVQLLGDVNVNRAKNYGGNGLLNINTTQSYTNQAQEKPKSYVQYKTSANIFAQRSGPAAEQMQASLNERFGEGLFIVENLNSTPGSLFNNINIRHVSDTVGEEFNVNGAKPATLKAADNYINTFGIKAP